MSIGGLVRNRKINSKTFTKHKISSKSFLVSEYSVLKDGETGDGRRETSDGRKETVDRRQ